ncbi:MAG: hypothetical protein R3E44_08315 [Paracoccaceae bacterium]
MLIFPPFKPALFLAALAFGPVPMPASAFTAQNDLAVESEGGDAFRVLWRGPGGPADFWCAAGDYAVRVLHLPPTDTIYRASATPRRSGEPMRFSLRADAAADATGLLALGTKGAGLSVGHAQSLCERHWRD